MNSNFFLRSRCLLFLYSLLMVYYIPSFSVGFVSHNNGVSNVCYRNRGRRKLPLPKSQPASHRPVSGRSKVLFPARTQIALPVVPVTTQEFWTELAVAGVLGTITDPLVERVYNYRKKKNPALEEKIKNDDDMEIRETFGFGAADSVSNAARVYGVLISIAYAADRFRVDSFLPSNLYESALTIAFLVWGVLTIGTVKRTFFLQMVSGTKLGRVGLYDRLIDFVLVLISTIVILDTLDFDIGTGVQSIFAASGVGALLFSLASKDLAEQIAGGVILQAADLFDVGDDVRFGDGTEGTVHKIGLVETEIIGYDNIAVKLPNSLIIKQRVSNISRMKEARVLQPLRFSYDDIDKVPKVLQDIKDEIKATCCDGALITDGSKPFAAVLGSYEADHIQSVINVHFRVQPFSQEYSDNKEKVLLAIAKAAKKNNVQFAIPSINYVDKNSDDSVAS